MSVGNTVSPLKRQTWQRGAIEADWIAVRTAICTRIENFERDIGGDNNWLGETNRETNHMQ